MKLSQAGWLLAAAAAAGVCASVHAQTPVKYPVKPMRMIVGFAPGGGTDILARLLAQKLAASLGEQVIVDNRPGAHGNLAAEFVAKAPADGYTLLIMSVQYAIGKAVYRNLGYDLEKDFVGVSDVAFVPQVVAVHPSLPVNSVKDLIALARSTPGQIAYASSGNGSVEHMAGEMLKNAARIDLLHVPYKGGAPAAVDLAAGQVFVGFGTIPAFLPFIKNGRIKVLAVTTPNRAAVLPDAPTVAESGIPGYDMNTWYGIIAAAGTPPAIVTTLNAEFVKILALPDIREKFLGIGADPLGRLKSDQFSAYIRSEVAKYSKIARDNNLRVE